MEWGWWVNVKYIARLIKRFTLQDYAQFPEAFRMSRIIQPVTQIDEVLRTLEIVRVTSDLSAATSWLDVITVTKGKRWILLGYLKEATTGTSGIAMQKPGEFPLDLEPQGSSESAVNLNTPIPLEEGWLIRRLTTGDGADTVEKTHIYFLEEDAF